MKKCRTCNTIKNDVDFRKYRNQCKSCENENKKAWNKKWYQNNKEKVYSQSRKYKSEHRERIRELSNLSGKKKRKEILNFLGGKCVRCGFSDWRVLQIDHINGGGVKEHKKISNTSTFYKTVKTHKEKYQVLCANCNWIKRYENNETALRLSA